MESLARHWLREAFGHEGEFRTGQLEAIEAVVARKQKVLVVQRTGWGKSIVYFIASKILREEGSGPILIISPLLSLMRNQIAMAKELFGLRVETINSTNHDDHEGIIESLEQDSVDVLIISPERLSNREFIDETLSTIEYKTGCLVIDEAHCISDWGHDFRPDYRRIIQIVRAMPPNVPVLCTTATANDRVIEDIKTQLGEEMRIIRGPLSRESLRLQCVHLPDQSARLAWLKRTIPRMEGAGIVYCLTQRDTHRVARWLQMNGTVAVAYHGGLDSEERVVLEDRLIRNDVKALVATVALGMGFDKPDLGFVVHFQRPGSLISYYQQVGRAGRGLEKADAIALCGKEDDDIHDYFLRTAFPTHQDLTSVLGVIERSELGVTPYKIQGELNLPGKRVEQCLKFLLIDNAIEKAGKTYVRTTNVWTYDDARPAAVIALRRRELDEMRAFTTTRVCLMRTVAEALDDASAKDCGRCANCEGPIFPTEVSRDDVLQALSFLRQDAPVIERRLQWYEESADRRNIPKSLRINSGYALSYYDDAGWGELVRNGKYQDGHFDDRLVHAAAGLIRDQWGPEPTPEWLTPIPSTRSGQVLQDFAERLAAELHIPYVEALSKRRSTRPQKDCENNVTKSLNVRGAFTARDGLPQGPVLLVDDIVESRWTLTAAGATLREKGVEVVHPFALASLER